MTVVILMYNVCKLQDLPPVRSHAGPGSSATTTAVGEKKKKRRKKNSSGSGGSEKQSGARQSRIKSYDYKAWDKFDVVGDSSKCVHIYVPQANTKIKAPPCKAYLHPYVQYHIIHHVAHSPCIYTFMQLSPFNMWEMNCKAEIFMDKKILPSPATCTFVLQKQFNFTNAVKVVMLSMQSLTSSQMIIFTNESGC